MNATIQMNEDTLRKAVQFYFDNVLFTKDNPVTVGNISEKSSPYAKTFEVSVVPKKALEKDSSDSSKVLIAAATK